MTDLKENLLKNFGELLRERRKKSGLSQEELALACGLDRTYISGLERGKRNPTLKVLALLAFSLKITVAELLTAQEINQ